MKREEKEGLLTILRSNPAESGKGQKLMNKKAKKHLRRDSIKSSRKIVSKGKQRKGGKKEKTDFSQ